MTCVFPAGHGRPVPRHLNTTLEVRKIPRDQNNIAKLNEHFGKFGVLKNIQVSSFTPSKRRNWLVNKSQFFALFF